MDEPLYRMKRHCMPCYLAFSKAWGKEGACPGGVFGQDDHLPIPVDLNYSFPS